MPLHPRDWCVVMSHRYLVDDMTELKSVPQWVRDIAVRTLGWVVYVKLPLDKPDCIDKAALLSQMG